MRVLFFPRYLSFSSSNGGVLDRSLELCQTIRSGAGCNGEKEKREREEEGGREGEGGREKKREPYKNIIERIYAILVLPSAASHTTSDIPGDPPGFSLVPGES